MYLIRNSTVTYEVRASSEGLGKVARASAPAVTDYVAAQPVRGVCALQHCGQLGIADTGLLASGADAAGADAHFDDVSSGQDQLLHHLASHHVAGDQSHIRKSSACALDVSNKL